VVEWLIALDEGRNADAPEFDGPKDKPVWSLYADQEPPLGGVRDKSGGRLHFGELRMYRYAAGETYERAVDLAHQLGLPGDPIGG
jgi:hypothetical protein